MENILVLLAAGFFLTAIIVGTTTDNSWKFVAVTWILLAIGSVIFGVALTI